MHFVYHPHHEPVIVAPEEYQHYLDNGWYDTPAKFPSNLAADEPKAEVSEPQAEEVEPIEAAPKKKGRPPKAKAEEIKGSVEL